MYQACRQSHITQLSRLYLESITDASLLEVGRTGRLKGNKRNEWKIETAVIGTGMEKIGHEEQRQRQERSSE